MPCWATNLPANELITINGAIMSLSRSATVRVHSERVHVVRAGLEVNPPHPGIRRFLDLSIKHLNDECLRWLHLETYGGSVFRARDAWFVHCRDDVERPGRVCADEGLPLVLVNILQHAIDLGCEYVLFDRDAEPDPALPLCSQEVPF